ncbi:MAG: SDR family oxidoreductase [Alphaproteobacteria bacterium]|nr:SDR family oxidoreductase [Alphaproteobacteria bacterium]
MAYKPFDLSGKTVLVTGGNGGIGLGMADAVAAAGADVVIWGTNAGKNDAAAATLKAHGGRVMTAKVDVSSQAAVQAGMADAVAKMGRIDAVFANAGIGNSARSFVDITPEQYRQVLAVNLDGVFFTLQEACRHMQARAVKGDPGGSLIVVASLAGIEGAARNEHYAATKGAVISIMKGVAVEYARYGIRANAILPGWIATDMTAGAQAAPQFAEKVIPRVPMRRWGQPEDFGGIAVYLSSNASAFHTGDTFLIDGGYAVF